MSAELFKALAQLQAQLPKVGKGQQATVPGKDGKRGYTYNYADLTDITEEVLPLMGKLGLAFMSRPTMIDGQFGLAYSLVHVSGEREDGFYPLRMDLTPQTLGGLITYARRYCLCAVTGVAPGGDDEDAARAEHTARVSAGDAFENAAPPQQRPRPVQPAAAAAEAIDPKAQAFADEAFKATTPAQIEDIHRRAREAGRVGKVIRNPGSGGGGQLAVYLDWRKKQLAAATRLDPDDPWAAKVEEIPEGDDDAAAAVLSEAAGLLGEGKMDDRHYAAITAAIEAKFPKAA